MKKILLIALTSMTLMNNLGAEEKGLIFDHNKSTKKEKEHLEIFDDLDYRVFSHQRWDDLDLSHSDDIVVHWPDGRVTKGIKAHIEDLKYMFSYAPDTHIEIHPIRIAKAEWTAVQGIIEGTFSEPMKTADGKVIPPTGKKYKLSMVTLGHWKNGKMDQEFLYWDNLSFMKQIGLL